MIIVWDEPKRASNLTTHGFDFAHLNAEFFLSAHIVPARAGRHKAIGMLADGTIVVIFAALGTEGLSVISMRRANAKERKLIDG